jgi:DNA-binding transcriptional LysR family regulator
MFDPDQLRSFLAVSESLNFTRAASRLGLAQPTVSQHVRKLEEAVGRRLLDRDTRGVQLTDDGQAMAGFARTILAAQDRATSYFTGSAMRGRLRFGAADDLALAQLPRVLRDFRKLHPRITLELTVAQSGALLRRLRAGQLDLVFIKQAVGQTEGQLVRRDRFVWVGLPGTSLEPSAPVPLITYQGSSLTRTTAERALSDAGRTWRITCKTQEVNGVLAAVRASLGITVFARSLIPSDLAQLPADLGLPELGDVDITLVANPQSPREPVEALTTAILDIA